ncbi:MAG: MBL fold metallo-hydrolase, partial [Thermoanaerobaculia bacterium]|nr:MBL fold metallo-hydrolase [Thermoanaerobaculia bacterium]
EVLDLGGRRLKVLRVPGHTPDSIALLDAENGLLFTGDTYYEAALWLHVPETRLDDYERSLSRLASLEVEIHYLLGAHNVVRMDFSRLDDVRKALRKLRSGTLTGERDADDRLSFEIDGVRFLTAAPVLRGEQGDPSRGGSGLDLWPVKD